MAVRGIIKYTDVFGCRIATATMRNAIEVGRLNNTMPQKDLVR